MKIFGFIQKQPDLEKMANIFLNSHTIPEQVGEAGASFIIALYGGNYTGQNLDEVCFQLFARAAVKTNFNFARLPPTQDAARFHSLWSLWSYHISQLR